MTWTLVEPCCGTAALTMHLLGARRQIVPRQGSKWRLRRELAAAMGIDEPPSRVILTDASPWGLACEVILSGDRDRLLRRLTLLVADGERDPRELHCELGGARVPTDPVEMTAELLWLQRMAYAGKCVRVVDGRWSSPGLNLTSALGVAATDRFGAVRPLGRALLEVVRAAPRARVDGAVGLARPSGLKGRIVVYLDPPYGTDESGRKLTGYGPADLTRSQVVELAREWADSGAHVYVSEASAIGELAGWDTVELGCVGGQRPTQLFRARHGAEWLTSRGARQLALL